MHSNGATWALSEQPTLLHVITQTSYAPSHARFGKETWGHAPPVPSPLSAVGRLTTEVVRLPPDANPSDAT